MRDNRHVETVRFVIFEDLVTPKVEELEHGNPIFSAKRAILLVVLYARIVVVVELFYLRKNLAVLDLLIDGTIERKYFIFRFLVNVLNLVPCLSYNYSYSASLDLVIF